MPFPQTDKKVSDVMADRLTFKECAESTPDGDGDFRGSAMEYKNNNRCHVKPNDVKWHPYASRREGKMVANAMSLIHKKKLSIRV